MSFATKRDAHAVACLHQVASLCLGMARAGSGKTSVEQALSSQVRAARACSGTSIGWAAAGAVGY